MDVTCVTAPPKWQSNLHRQERDNKILKRQTSSIVVATRFILGGLNRYSLRCSGITKGDSHFMTVTVINAPVTHLSHLLAGKGDMV